MFEICLHLQFPTWYEQNTELFDNYVFWSTVQVEI